MGKLFGTDGVRGIANSQLTPELAFNLGRAGAYALTKENSHAPKIIVGMDTRRSGHMLEAAITAGMCSVGATVISAGVIPTPGIAYLVRHHKLDAGVVISASHNPMADNGIKFFNAQGYKLRDELEDEIEDILYNGLSDLPCPIGAAVGSRDVWEDALEEYVEFLKETFKSWGQSKTLDGLKIAIDCANGATYKAAPLVFYELGASVSALHSEPDGCNINLNCGSTHMESLVEYVKENKMDIGIAFDGDGDRCLCVDENGTVFTGDKILSVCGCYLKEKGRLKNNTIVATVMSNLGLMIMGEKQGIQIEQTKVGDRYVLEKMMEGNYSLGGESSGHVIFLDHSTTGDGILTALLILSVMKATEKSLSELGSVIEIMPQILVNARIGSAKKMDYLYNDKIKAGIEALEQKFAGEGRVLIRPSGTEPLIRVMIEGRDEAVMLEEANQLAALLEKELGE